VVSYPRRVDVEARQLADIAELGALLDSGGLDYWLFGGWAVDFHVGTVTRPHGDIDLAVWSRDARAISDLLAVEGWRHTPAIDEDGGTGYERDGIRLELTFLVEGGRGEVLLALSQGTAVWSTHPFGTEVRALGGVHARVIPLGVLRAGKSVPRQDADEALVDRADFGALSRLTPKPLG
jgi:hypothetical protein